MANDNDSVDSNGNSTDLRPRRSNRAKGKPIQQLEETDENVVVHNNVVYKIGDFVYYLDKKQDVYRIGLIEEFKHQKRDKLVNKRPEISVKQFYRLDEIPSSVLSNQGEYDTHVLPPNFPEWLRQREIFISDNALSTSCSSLRSLCTVRHFPDLNHAMALFSTAQSSGQVTNSSPRVDHHPIITGNKDNSCIPVPKQRDDNTFFYVYSYNARGRKLAATYLEIRVGPAYQVELPELRSPEEQLTDGRYVPGAWEQLMWKPNQIPEEVFNVYNMATISIACFSGFGGGVDDSASVENGRKIASHMLTGQRALDCMHRAQYVMEKAMETFAENALPETSKMPFLWTDEDHVLFDESVKIHGKNFLRIKQDKRNKKGRLVGDYVTFYYYWKKNRPKNRKYATKKNLRSRASVLPATAEGGAELEGIKREPTEDGGAGTEKGCEGGQGAGAELGTMFPTDASIECCLNCKVPLPKPEEDTVASSESDRAPLSERMRTLCFKCQHYLRRYGYQKPVELAAADKTKATSEDDDFEEGTNGLDDDEEEEDEAEGEDEEEDEVFQAQAPPGGSPHSQAVCAPADDGRHAQPDSSSSKTSLAINKYDFDEEDENVEEVSSLLKKSHQAKHHGHGGGQLPRDAEAKASAYKGQPAPGFYPAAAKGAVFAGGKPFLGTKSTAAPAPTPAAGKGAVSGTQRSTGKRGAGANASAGLGKRRRLDADPTAAATPPSRQIHESLKTSLALPASLAAPGAPSDKRHREHKLASSQYDSSSGTSSSSSTSNDSSSSGDEVDTLPLVKRAAAVAKAEGAKETATKAAAEPSSISISGATAHKDASASASAQQPATGADASYNQMITCIPNIPGVCAVTNVGEPMPQLMQNLSTDLSAPQSASAVDLNLTVAEPLYKQLSLRSGGAEAAAKAMPPAHAPAPAETATPPAKFVNFNAIGPSTPRPVCEAGNPEETGLNLVKPKKAVPAYADHQQQPQQHNWAPPHDQPSKLVHHRGDAFADSVAGAASSDIPVPRQTINDNEVLHSSIFGHVVRVQRGVDCCARTDLQHTRSALRPSDLDKQRLYIVKAREAEQQQEPRRPAQDDAASAKRASGSMLPPSANPSGQVSAPPGGDGKGVVHHQSAPGKQQQHYSLPALTQPQQQQQLQASLSARKIGHRSQSPAGARTQGGAPAAPSSSLQSSLSSAAVAAGGGMMRPGQQQMHQRQPAGMHMQGPPPGMQAVGNTSLLADYNNMNKVNMNELLFFQPQHQQPPPQHQQQGYEELQKLMMMYASMPPMRASLQQQQWEQQQQRERNGGGSGVFGPSSSAADAWGGGGGGGGVGMGAPMNPDLQALLRLLAQAPPNPHGRPRSAAGLNLSNGGDPKPGSGRASANHDYGQQQQQQQQQGVPENPEALERLLLAEYQNLFAGIQPKPSQQQQGAQPPPVAHGLGGPFVGGPFQGGPSHLGLAPLLASKPPPPPHPSQAFPGGLAAQRQVLNEFFQLYMGGYGINPSR